MSWRIVVATLSLTLGATGCGGGSGGQPDTLGGITKYEAAVVARDAMNDEILEPESIAYDTTLLVGETTADQLEDGTQAWRVAFVTIDERPSGVCLWVWIESRTPLRDNYGYDVDTCPATGAT